MKKKYKISKGQRTIERNLKVLRAIVESPDSDEVLSRIAYTMEHVIRWATERTVGWPEMKETAEQLAELLRQELLK